MRETQATPRGDAKACSCRRLAPLTPEKGRVTTARPFFILPSLPTRREETFPIV